MIIKLEWDEIKEIIKKYISWITLNKLFKKNMYTWYNQKNYVKIMIIKLEWDEIKKISKKYMGWINYSWDIQSI